MTVSFSAEDHRFMTRALALARAGLGRTWPNPSVGCVVAKDGAVAGEARTADGGRPHAEPLALAQAGDRARGATAYVTLEPCNTHGKTPPCVDALIAAGVARVVVACADPYQDRHGGQGAARLRAAGIKFEPGLLAGEAAALNEGFFLSLSAGRPLVAVKLATTLDSRIATKSGESQWITGPAARQRGHELRACHDAVMAGIGTVLADDPLLTVRLPAGVDDTATDRQPVRIVIDRDLRIPLSAQLAAGARADRPVWIVCSPAADREKAAALSARGVRLLPVPAGADGHIPAGDIAAALAAEGITRLLVEGGAATSGAFLRAGLADRLYWFRAPVLMGGDGLAGIAALGVESLRDMPRFTHEGTERLGDDFLDIWRRKD